MSAPLLAVIDIGKTNAKVAFIDTQSGAEVWSGKRVNRIVATPLGRALDLQEIEHWLVDALRRAPHKDRVAAIVPIAHGAAAVLLDEDCAVVAAPDYEDPQFASVNEHYQVERDPFEETLSPSLPLGLNLARQFFFLERQHPDEFARVMHILLHPQYWAWRFSGAMASEVTSLGCHTDLWSPRSKGFSRLARVHGWAPLFPPAAYAGETLGTLTPAMVERTGLPHECRVICGIHDSNACWLEHSIRRTRGESFAVVSSGTWTVVMANCAAPARLQADRDMLANVDAFGSIVCTARFMGGREYEAIAGSTVAPDADSLAAVLRRRVMAIPSFASGGPFAAHRGEIVHSGPMSDQERAALATLYTALMTQLLLERLDVTGDTIVDGPLSANPLFAPLLAALGPASRIVAGAAATSGARAACYLAGIDLPRIEAAPVVQPLQISGLDAYRADWRRLLPDRWPENVRSP